jgi:hypothetical protein
MWTLVFAMLFLLLFGSLGSLRLEGTARVGGLLSSCTFARLGRVCVGIWSYRPGRVYYRLEVIRCR